MSSESCLTFIPLFPVRFPSIQTLHRVSEENRRDVTSLVHYGREDLQDRGGVYESPDEEDE